MLDYKKLKGDMAIDFCLRDRNGKDTSLKSFENRWIVIFFFDNTSLNSKESEIIFFSKAEKEFKDLNADIVGIGTTTQREIDKFCSDYNVNIPLLSDVDWKISEKYGVVSFDKDNNKKIFPITFLINKDRIILDMWNRKKMYYRITGYADDVENLWEKSRMWAHIAIVTNAIEWIYKNK